MKNASYLLNASLLQATTDNFDKQDDETDSDEPDKTKSPLLGEFELKMSKFSGKLKEQKIAPEACEDPWCFLIDWVLSVTGIIFPKYLVMVPDAQMANLADFSVAAGYALLGLDATDDEGALTELTEKLGDIFMGMLLAEGAPSFHINPGFLTKECRPSGLQTG